jgi:hypothetical protein
MVVAAHTMSHRDESLNHASCLPAEIDTGGRPRESFHSDLYQGLESDLHAEAEVHFAGWFPAPDAPVLHGRLV